MATQIVYPNGSIRDILVPAGSKIAIGTYDGGICQIYYRTGPGNSNPDTYYLQQQLTDNEVTLGTFAADRYVGIDAGAQPVFYDVSTAPAITRMTSKLVTRSQGAPTAKTTSTTLTTAELVPGIITVNQGAGGASALQLPTAANMDALFTSIGTDESFDFVVINISTVAAEDATITTNTGWTLVGNINIASNAAATDISFATFRARKTGTAAWTLYRIG